MKSAVCFSVAAVMGFSFYSSRPAKLSKKKIDTEGLRIKGALYISQSFERKINAMKADGLNQLQIISDFDRTLTTSTSSECHSIIGQSVSTPDVFREQFAKFIDFAPQKYARSLTADEWWSQTADCMTKYQLNRSMLKQAVSSACYMDSDGKCEVMLRPMVKEMFISTEKLGIPILVVSAGLDFVISEIFANYNIPNSHLKIYANHMKFDSSGDHAVLHSITPSPAIHTKTKKYMVNHCTSYFKNIQRSNVIFLGDKVSDVKSIDGFENKKMNILKIGWLVPRTGITINNLEETYSEVYDIVLPHDMSIEPVIQIIHHITGQ